MKHMPMPSLHHAKWLLMIGLCAGFTTACSEEDPDNTVNCDETPEDLSCKTGDDVDCDETPDDPSCKTSDDVNCEETPEDPECKTGDGVDCDETPDEPSCKSGDDVNCEETPEDPKCQNDETPEVLQQQAFVATLGAGNGRVCYNIASDENVDCDDGSDAWDLMVEIDGRDFNIWTNGGVYGTGEGAALGPFPQSELNQFESLGQVPGWFADVIGGIFVDAPWQSYDVMGTHDISANGRVYAIDTGNDVYRFQITSYYTNGESGRLNIRFASLEDDPSNAVTMTIDATAGGFGTGTDNPANKFTYLDLDTATILDLTDEEARTNTEWDVGFKRFDVIVNGGISGSGSAKGALAVDSEGFYDADGNPIRAAFESLDDTAMQNAFESSIDETALHYVSDRGTPFLNNDGVSASSWFSVIPPPAGPDFVANDENWWFLRSADKTHFAQIHVANIDYSSTERVFTIELFVGTK